MKYLLILSTILFLGVGCNQTAPSSDAAIKEQTIKELTKQVEELKTLVVTSTQEAVTSTVEVVKPTKIEPILPVVAPVKPVTKPVVLPIVKPIAQPIVQPEQKIEEPKDDSLEKIAELEKQLAAQKAEKTALEKQKQLKAEQDAAFLKALNDITEYTNEKPKSDLEKMYQEAGIDPYFQYGGQPINNQPISLPKSNLDYFIKQQEEQFKYDSLQKQVNQLKWDQEMDEMDSYLDNIKQNNNSWNTDYSWKPKLLPSINNNDYFNSPGGIGALW